MQRLRGGRNREVVGVAAWKSRQNEVGKGLERSAGPGCSGRVGRGEKLALGSHGKG